MKKGRKMKQEGNLGKQYKENEGTGRKTKKKK